MSDSVQPTTEDRKLSRLEREQRKLDLAQANIDKILATEKKKKEKEDTNRKILLGVVCQGLIADGLISAEQFDRALVKYLHRDRDREKCNVYFDSHSPKVNPTSLRPIVQSVLKPPAVIEPEDDDEKLSSSYYPA
jgi:hypothetical protein